MRKMLVLSLLAVAGCHSALDSGYEPRRLTATDAQRRAYYSSPYSEETQQALQEDARFGEDRKPTKY